MQPDWDYVKKTTLWRYEELVKKLHAALNYPVIYQKYNHDMVQAEIYARRLFPLSSIEVGAYPAEVINTIKRLQSAGVSDWKNLLDQVVTREDCVKFTAEHQLGFEGLIDVLNYLLRWGFPFQTAARELLNHDHPQEMAYFRNLKQHKVMNSFALLQQGHTLPKQYKLAEAAGLPLDFVTSLVHRADIARLPFVRRKTILAVCGAGYNTLAKIAAAPPAQMETRLDSYFRRTQGKPWDNFKSVILIDGLISSAKVIPVIVEV